MCPFSFNRNLNLIIRIFFRTKKHSLHFVFTFLSSKSFGFNRVGIVVVLFHNLVAFVIPVLLTAATFGIFLASGAMVTIFLCGDVSLRPEIMTLFQSIPKEDVLKCPFSCFLGYVAVNLVISIVVEPVFFDLFLAGSIFVFNIDLFAAFTFFNTEVGSTL